MNSLETALRAALSKGDVSDPIYRRRVYESAAKAIHKTLEAKGTATEKEFEDQRLRLADTIRAIEREIKPSSPRPNPRADRAAPSQARAVQAAENVAPEINTAPSIDTAENRLYAEPRLDEVAPTEPPVTAQKNQRKIRRKAPFAKFLTGTVAIALLGIGLVWVITTGVFQTAEERDTSVPNPEVQLQSESFEGRDPGTASAPQTLETIDGDSGEWVTLFSPVDPTTLGLVGGAAASIKQGPFGDFAELDMPNNESEVQIDIPVNVLQQASGRTIQLSLQARADTEATQMSVTCDLGTLATCRRVRFNVGRAANEFLLQVPVAADARTSGVGTIKIKTNIDSGAHKIELRSARARILEN